MKSISACLWAACFSVMGFFFIRLIFMGDRITIYWLEIILSYGCAALVNLVFFYKPEVKK